MSRHLAVLGLFLVLSALWSWPTARLDAAVLVTRHFDAYPAAWLVAVAPGIGPDLVSRATAWPLGEPLGRLDSGLFALVAWALGGALPPVLVVAAWAWVGPALSAFAAERCAGAAFGVARPWSIFAGVAFGFAGIGAQALLEGHVYHLLAPWLPLAWWAWTVDRPARAGSGLGGAWALALLSTAYAAVNVTLLVGALAVADPGRARRVLPWALPLAGPVALAWALSFARGGAFAAGDPAFGERVGRMGTPTVAGLLTWSPLTDLAHHSMAAPLGFTGLLLVLAAPWVLRDAPGWRAPVVLAAGAVVGALGRSVRLVEGVDLFDWGLEGLGGLPGGGGFRFPIRLLWVWAVVSGVVGARVLASLALRAPGLATGVLVLGALEAVVAPALPARLDRVPAGAPSVYAAAPVGRAVLDLWGRREDEGEGWEMWTRNLGCFYQATHRRPILEVCLGTSVESPREVVEAWLLPRLGDPAAWSQLGRLGVGAVVFHVDTWPAAEVDAVRRALGPAVEGRDGGEHLLLYPVTPTAADPVSAWAELRRTP